MIWDIHTVIETERRVPWVRPSVQYLNNRSHGKNLSSTPAQAELIAQYSVQYDCTLPMKYCNVENVQHQCYWRSLKETKDFLIAVEKMDDAWRKSEFITPNRSPIESHDTTHLPSRKKIEYGKYVQCLGWNVKEFEHFHLYPITLCR
jgi:hypothetical protein